MIPLVGFLGPECKGEGRWRGGQVLWEGGPLQACWGWVGSERHISTWHESIHPSRTRSGCQTSWPGGKRFLTVPVLRGGEAPAPGGAAPRLLTCPACQTPRSSLDSPCRRDTAGLTRCLPGPSTGLKLRATAACLEAAPSQLPAHAASQERRHVRAMVRAGSHGV